MVHGGDKPRPLPSVSIYRDAFRGHTWMMPLVAQHFSHRWLKRRTGWRRRKVIFGRGREDDDGGGQSTDRRPDVDAYTKDDLNTLTLDILPSLGATARSNRKVQLCRWIVSPFDPRYRYPLLFFKISCEWEQSRVLLDRHQSKPIPPFPFTHLFQLFNDAYETSNFNTLHVIFTANFAGSGIHFWWFWFTTQHGCLIWICIPRKAWNASVRIRQFCPCIFCYR